MEDTNLASRMAGVSTAWRATRLRYRMQEPAVFSVIGLVDINTSDLLAQEEEERTAARAMSSLQSKLRPRGADGKQAPRARSPKPRAGRGARRPRGRGGRKAAAAAEGDPRPAEEVGVGDDGDDMMVPDPVEVEQAEAAPLPNYDRRSGRVSNAAGMYTGAVRHTKVGDPAIWCVFNALPTSAREGVGP